MCLCYVCEPLKLCLVCSPVMVGFFSPCLFISEAQQRQPGPCSAKPHTRLPVFIKATGGPDPSSSGPGPLPVPSLSQRVKNRRVQGTARLGKKWSLCSFLKLAVAPSAKSINPFTHHKILPHNPPFWWYMLYFNIFIVINFVYYIFCHSTLVLGLDLFHFIMLGKWPAF